MAPPKYSIWSMVAPSVRAAMRRQGSQFSSTDFIKVLAGREIKISMDGKGAAELCPKVDGAVKSRFILGAGPSIFGHDYIARQKDR